MPTPFVSLLSSFDLLPWKERVDGRPWEGFIAHVSIGGMDFHAMAIPVTLRGERHDLQEALDRNNDDELEALYAAWEPGSPFTTARLKGYDCVITFQPFAE